MSIAELLGAIMAIPSCVVHAPEGLPELEEGHILPDEVREFYTLCGGANLFTDDVFALSIVPPHGMVVANPVIIPSLSPQDIAESKASGEISWAWYVLAEGDPTMGGQYVTIDLSPARLGRCYDSFWDTHPESSTIIALSFAEFLRKVLQGGEHGRPWYWDERNFRPLGSAYE